MDIHFELDDDQQNGRFYDVVNGQRKAVMEVMLRPKRLVIKNTEVAEDHLQQDVGRGLLNAATQYARKNRQKVLPVCPFAKELMLRFPEHYGDLMV